MKKKLLTIVIAMMIISIAISVFAGCDTGNNTEQVWRPGTPDNNDSSNNNDSNDTPAQEQTEYDKLSKEEKAFFNVFKTKISLFKDPASVRIISFNRSLYNGAVIDFKVSGKNSFGSTITNGYLLFLKEWVANGVTEKKYAYLETDCNAVLPNFMISYEEINDNEVDFTISALSDLIYPAEEDIDDVVLSVTKVNKAIIEYIEEQGWV